MNKVNKDIEICRSYFNKCYSPYSKFNVVSVLSIDDEKYFGINVENCSYSLTVCAETNCITTALTTDPSIKDRKDWSNCFMIVLTNTADEITPCGSCRQVLAEFLPENFIVYTVGNNNIVKKYLLKELLPFGFIK